LVLTAPVKMPPAKYDHPPTIAYSVTYLPSKQFANLKCPGSADLMRGCTVRGKGMNGRYVAWVYVRNDLCPGRKPDACKLSQGVLRHELGHVNGWPSNHPH